MSPRCGCSTRTSGVPVKPRYRFPAAKRKPGDDSPRATGGPPPLPAPVLVGDAGYALLPRDGGSQVVAVARDGLRVIAELPGVPVAIAAGPDGSLVAATARGPHTDLWRGPARAP